ncbi:MAG: glycosyltransferase family 2 protein [Nostoc sp. ChiSLP02]|nr:glycosyltransferase family 2 protein [Nostoc sp. DedSLP05]MDZ8100800.1 glycosyltransferase family 2 protein [Nostoc sp. DedSLP01]MDZ8188211.1 glycosyltransferase family 2 protein [Nostoc sp. ChiSLP02]
MISVIIPCHNSAQWLPETLTSLQQQENITEVILVDDASTDESVKVANLYSSTLPIRVISSLDRGVSAARNTGLSCARGEWIQFLDADDILMPGKLSRHLQIGISYQADVVYGSWQAYQEMEKGIFVPQDVTIPDYSGDLIVRLLGADNFCQIGAILFRRQAILKVGGFRVDMHCIEDVNLYLRLGLSGAQFVKDKSEKICLLYRKYQTFSSLGTRNSLEFYAGCLTNVRLVEAAWQEQTDTIFTQRQKFLLEAYEHLARFYFEHDRSKFYEVLAIIYNLNPNYLPSRPRALRQLSKWFGYEQAEAMALAYRRVKKFLNKLMFVFSSILAISRPTAIF